LRHGQHPGVVLRQSGEVPIRHGFKVIHGFVGTFELAEEFIRPKFMGTSPVT